jgi:hypothetical protein
VTPPDPPRWKERPPGDATAEDRAGAMARAIGASVPPGDVALARLRTAVLARAVRGGRARLLPAATVVAFAAGAALALWISRDHAAGRDVRVATAGGAGPSPASGARMPAWTPAATTPAERRPGELELLRRMPPGALLALRGEQVDDEGLAAFSNRRGFLCSGNQRFALEGMTVGAALQRADLVDEAWRAIETTFRYQADDGSFLDGALCVSYFLSHLAHALLVLDESELAPASGERMRALLPRVARAAAWLSLPAQRAALDGSARDFPSRLLYHATALALSGRLLDDGALAQAGAEYAARALDLQRPDGSFAMQPHLESRYLGSVLWKLGWYALRFPDARAVEALRRAGRHQLARVDPDGTVDMSDSAAAWAALKDVRRVANVQEVAWGLLYYGALCDDGEALAAADRVLARNRARTGPP